MFDLCLNAMIFNKKRGKECYTYRAWTQYCREQRAIAGNSCTGCLWRYYCKRTSLSYGIK